MKKVVIIQKENWFTFSPSGHANYDRRDEIKIHGIYNLMLALKKYHCMVNLVRGYAVNVTYYKASELNVMLSQC